MAPVDPAYKPGRTYVAVYSSLNWAFDNQLVDLGANLSIRNVSLTKEIVIESVDYYDSAGTRVRRHLERPSRLAAMASTEFVVSMLDRSGGSGANFLVDWAVPPGGDEPYIEAIMIGQRGNSGISFTSLGHSTLRER